MPDLRTSLAYCTYCPKLCRHTCPVSHVTAKETLVPRDKMATMARLRPGYPGTPPSERTVEETEPLYGCTGCGACTAFCQHQVEVGPALFRGREEAEREGRGHPALEGRGFVERFRAHGETAAEALRERVPAERRAREAQVAFLPGCQSPERAGDMLALCDRLDASYVTVGEMTGACGGYPLLAAGQHDAFRLHAERVAESLSGYARVVMHCPSCAWAMKTQYAAFGVPLRPTVEHTVEFLQQFAERLPVVEGKKRARAHWHDPCYLGRHQRLYDEPRRLAQKVITQLDEFSRARDESACSGGGGLLPITMPETADAIAKERVREVKEAGASTVVTSCASCVQRLSRDGVEAVDLLALLNQATE